MGEELVLGDEINFSGFGELESEELLVVKKMVDNFVKKLGLDNVKLSLNLKGIHRTEISQKHEIKGVLDFNGDIKQAEVVDYNLFFALNKVLEKLK